jgi:hypothetical protein
MPGQSDGRTKRKATEKDPEAEDAGLRVQSELGLLCIWTFVFRMQAPPEPGRRHVNHGGCCKSYTLLDFTATI